MKINIHIWYVANFFLKKVLEKTSTHILCSVTFFLENRAVYDVTWKHIVVAGSPQMTIWRMRIACWIPTATNSHSEYVIRILPALSIKITPLMGHERNRQANML